MDIHRQTDFHYIAFLPFLLQGGIAILNGIGNLFAVQLYYYWCSSGIGVGVKIALHGLVDGPTRDAHFQCELTIVNC